MKTGRERTEHLLLFQSLIDAEASCAFPCDSRGHVDMDSLSDGAREDYLYARAVIGREFAPPAVIEATAHGSVCRFTSRASG